MGREPVSGPGPGLIAYGCQIDSDTDLEPYLCRGKGRCGLRVSAATPGARLPELSERLPLFTSHGREVTLCTDRELGDSQPGQPWRFEVADVVAFDWAGGGNEIVYRRSETCTDELFAFWLIHLFLPLYFTLESVYEFIHAGAVEVGDETILFIAPSHGGKSTMTDFFLGQGHSLVSDDKVATFVEKETYWAVPSHPNHRPYRRFEDLGMRVDSFDTEARPVHAVYRLVRADPDADITIREVRGHGKFADMLPNFLFNFSHLGARRMEYLARMAGAVPLYTVDLPWDLERLGEVYRAILEHRELDEQGVS